MNNTTHKYKAKQELNGIYLLQKDGNGCNCPKTLALLPQQNALNPEQLRMNPTQYPCSTLCPFAEIKSMTPKELGWGDDDEIRISIYEISCEGGTKRIVLDEVKDNVQKNGLVKTM